MRTFGALLVSGVTGILVLKVLAGLLLPFLGFFAIALKIVLFGVIAYVVYNFLKNRKRRAEEV